MYGELWLGEMRYGEVGSNRAKRKFSPIGDSLKVGESLGPGPGGRAFWHSRGKLVSTFSFTSCCLPGSALGRENPCLFYALAFIASYQIRTLFEELRAIARSNC